MQWGLALPHVNDLVDNSTGLIVAVRVDVIQEELEVAYHYKLADPAFSDASRTWNLVGLEILAMKYYNMASTLHF